MDIEIIGPSDFTTAIAKRIGEKYPAAKVTNNGRDDNEPTGTPQGSKPNTNPTGARNAGVSENN